MLILKGDIVNNWDNNFSTFFYLSQEVSTLYSSIIIICLLYTHSIQVTYSYIHITNSTFMSETIQITCCSYNMLFAIDPITLCYTYIAGEHARLHYNIFTILHAISVTGELWPPVTPSILKPKGRKLLIGLITILYYSPEKFARHVNVVLLTMMLRVMKN